METSCLIIISAICLMLTIITGWLIAIMRYLKTDFLKNIFPGFKYLKKAHVDYAMMGGLVFAVSLVLVKLNVRLTNPELIALSVGALYNPSGFMFQAVKPTIADSDSVAFNGLILAGFIPATYGFGVAAVKIIMAVL